MHEQRKQIITRRILLALIVSRSQLGATRLLVIALSGFRYSYMSTYKNYGLDQFVGRGASAMRGIKSSFVTQSPANLWTIATGLNQESHGLVSWKFYDPIRQVFYNRQSGDINFYGGEPIWKTARKNGLKVAVIEWTGCQVDFGPYNAHICLTRQQISDKTIEHRISLAIEYTKKHHLTMVFYDSPDRIGHKFGPGNETLSLELEQINNALRPLLDYMNQFQRLDVIILSDHGMASFEKATRINISSWTTRINSEYKTRLDARSMHLLEKNIIISSTGTLTNFYYPNNTNYSQRMLAYLHRSIIAGLDENDAEKQKIIETIKANHSLDLTKPIKIDGITYYLKHEIPGHWFYRNSHHIGDLVAVADEGRYLEVMRVID